LEILDSAGCIESKTVKTVKLLRFNLDTGLKPGENEREALNYQFTILK